MQSNLLFQYCQKLIILSASKQSVLLARRKDEADYNGVYSFIGGKMETTDESMLLGMKREEIGPEAVVAVYPHETYNLLFRKKDGNSMILPHVAGVFVSGDITLSDEYSDYVWAPITTLDTFEPKIDNIPQLTDWAVQKVAAVDNSQLEEI